MLDFSGQNTPVMISLLKLQGTLQLSRGTNEENICFGFYKKYDNEDTIEDDVRETKHSWRHYENCERKNLFSDFIDVKDSHGRWQSGMILMM